MPCADAVKPPNIGDFAPYVKKPEKNPKNPLTKPLYMSIIILVARSIGWHGIIYADVAELADALDSGSSSLKRVWVQIPSSAPKPLQANPCEGFLRI